MAIGEQYHLLVRLLALAEKRDQSLKRTSHLATGQLLDSGVRLPALICPSASGKASKPISFTFRGGCEP
jgi:hypothetical protein